MNATNRIVNRVVLLIAAMLLLLGGAALLVAGTAANGIRFDWAERAADAVSDAWALFAGSTLDIAGIGTVSVAAVVAVAVTLAALVLLVVFLSTRGGGRTSEVWLLDGADGRTTVDRSVADALLGAPLRDRPDVVSATVAAYLVSGQRAIELSVRVQPTARLEAVIAATEAAVSDWDALLGERTPVVLHLSDRSWRDALRPRTRVS